MRSWWRGVSPLTKLSLLFIVGLVATALVGLPVKAQAAGSDSNWHGYFYGGGPVYYGA